MMNRIGTIGLVCLSSAFVLGVVAGILYYPPILCIVGLASCFSALICGIVAGVLYDPPIQRYLEKMGGHPAFFGFNWSGSQDYLNAAKMAKQWGHNPPFLKRYGRMMIAVYVLFFGGAVLFLLGMFFGAT
jgi:hypothetical protein